MEKKNKLLGILGGLGPMSTVYFYEMLTSLTKAECDQEHIDIVISSRATTPDRTAFITGKSDENPLSAMVPDAKKLVEFGADIIAIPCNTAHYFYDSLAAEIDVPILNIIEESVKHLKSQNVSRFGLLATDGTVNSLTYQRYCESHGIECVTPDAPYQAKVMELIYSQIKKGKNADMDSFLEISAHLRDMGCERVILGCTELSLIKKQASLDSFYVDSLECLALSTIKACGKTTIYG